jgi:hypothetical protein
LLKLDKSEKDLVDQTEAGRFFLENGPVREDLFYEWTVGRFKGPIKQAILRNGPIRKLVSRS